MNKKNFEKRIKIKKRIETKKRFLLLIERARKLQEKFEQRQKNDEIESIMYIYTQMEKNLTEIENVAEKEENIERKKFILSYVSDYKKLLSYYKEQIK